MNALDHLTGTPYLPGDSPESVDRFERVLRRSRAVADRVQTYRISLRTRSTEVQRLLVGAEREKQVVESNRIEGNMWDIPSATEAVARSQDILDAPLRDLMRSVEADPHAYQVLGLYKAYEICDRWAHEDRRPSEVEIRQLHHLVTAGDRGAGEYRTHVGTTIKGQAHVPPDSIEVPRMMAELAKWWQNTSVDPLLVATVVHAWFTHIHPFHDGNGRLARLLASISLVQAGYPPLIIGSDSTRDQYYDHLAASDDGNILPLLELFGTLQEKEARLLSRDDYVDSILNRSIFRDPSNRHRAWLVYYERFLAALQTEVERVGWSFRRLGLPDAGQFVLLEERDSAGNSWAAVIQDPMGNEWLMWFGFQSMALTDVIGGMQPTPALYFSPRDLGVETEHPYRRRGENEGAEDGVPDEIALVANAKLRCFIRRGHEVDEVEPAEAALRVRQGMVHAQRQTLNRK